MTNFDNALLAWSKIASTSLAFGEFAAAAVENEGRTIREISIALCGNNGLEDRIARYVQAAKWDRLIATHPVYRVLYEDMRDWLTVGHFTELWRQYDAAEDKHDILDIFEQLFIRDLRTEAVEQVHTLEWLRAQRRSDEPDLSTWQHRIWLNVSKALPMYVGELERKGLLATPSDRFKVKLLRFVLREFTAERMPELPLTEAK